MENKPILITEESEIYKTTATAILLYNYFKEEEEKIIIYVPNEFVRDFLSEKQLDFQNVLKKNVSFIIDTSLFQEEIENKEKETNIPTKEGQLLLGSFIIQDYIEIPYLVDETNKLIAAAGEKIIKEKFLPFLLLYGPSGTGKSHFLYHTAYEAYKNYKMNVYIINSRDFIEEVKNHLKNDSIYMFKKTIYEKADLFCIDDFQFFDNKNLVFIQDILFEIINTLMNTKRKMIFTSDVSPFIYSHMHERITSRIMSGIAFETEKPSLNIKTQFTHAYSQKYEIQIDDDIEKYILDNTSDLREIKILLNYYKLMREEDGSQHTNFKDFLPVFMLQKRGDKIKTFINSIRMILSNHFGEISETESGQRKSRTRANVDSVTYYSLLSVIDKKRLLNTLQIETKHARYFYTKGEKLYQTLPDSLKAFIKKRISQYA